MAIAYITSTFASSSDGGSVTTSSINTTGANLLVVNVAWYLPNGNPTVTDSKGNTWSGLTIPSGPGGQGTRLYICRPTATGSGHTFSVASSAYPGIAVAAFSGVSPSGTIKESSFGAGSSASGAQTAQPGSITPDMSGSLFILGANVAGTSPSINSGFTGIASPLVNGLSYACFLGYLIQSTATAINPTLSWTNVDGGEKSVVMASFNSAPSSGSIIDLYSAWPEMNS